MIKCDCGKIYNPSKRKKDSRYRCEDCIRNVKSSDVKKQIIDYLGGKCVDCGFRGHFIAYDFDHIDRSKKEFKISGHYLFRWDELKKELDNIQLRCSNCHRIKDYIIDTYTI